MGSFDSNTSPFIQCFLVSSNSDPDESKNQLFNEKLASMNIWNNVFRANYSVLL